MSETSTRPAATGYVLVVVVTFNSADVLPDLLASLPGGMDGVAWRLAVADNASSDDSVALVRRLSPDALVVETGRNAGYSAGINAAVAAGVAAGVQHDAVLVLNPDVRLTPGCGRTLLDTLGDPRVGIVVPRLQDGSGALIFSMRRRPTVLRALGDAALGARRAGRVPVLGEVVTNPREYRHTQDLDWAEGSTQMVSAACWTRCGSWDESYFLYSEEAEYDLRVGDVGYLVRYQPAARATHLKGGSGTSPGLWRLLVLNRVRLYGRRNGTLPTAAFWLATLLREASRALLGKETSRVATRALCSPRRWRQAPGPDAVTY